MKQNCPKCDAELEEQFCVVPLFFECPNGCESEGELK